MSVSAQAYEAAGVPQTLLEALRPITIITGHYGSGKTNFALNLARDLAQTCDVVLVDLDIVNPYFRSSEYNALLEKLDVSVIGPVMANSSLDTPSLSPAIDGVLDWAVSETTESNKPRIALLDVGGDDAGAMALGRYRTHIDELDYAMLYVVNANRNLTQSSDEALEIMHEIETVSGLRTTGIINNTHLRELTTAQTIIDFSNFGSQVAIQASLPLTTQTAPDWCINEIGDTLETQSLYSVKLLVTLPWEQPAAEDI